jgi:hypothetical protein
MACPARDEERHGRGAVAPSGASRGQAGAEAGPQTAAKAGPPRSQARNHDVSATGSARRQDCSCRARRHLSSTRGELRSGRSDSTQGLTFPARSR